VLVSVVEAVMLQLHYGLLTSLLAVRIASEKDLQEWSGEIGSDIPFFFSRGAAYCTGRGEVCFSWFLV